MKIFWRMRFKLKQQQINTHEKFHFSVQLTKKNISLLTNKRSHTCKNWMQEIRIGNQTHPQYQYSTCTCLPILLWFQPANQRNLPSKTRKSRILNTSTQSVLILTVPLLLVWSWIHNCIPDTCPVHSRYLTGNLWKMLVVWIWIPYGGWMLVYGRIPMKAELVNRVVVYGRRTVLVEAGVS